MHIYSLANRCGSYTYTCSRRHVNTHTRSHVINFLKKKNKANDQNTFWRFKDQSGIKLNIVKIKIFLANMSLVQQFILLLPRNPRFRPHSHIYCTKKINKHFENLGTKMKFKPLFLINLPKGIFPMRFQRKCVNLEGIIRKFKISYDSHPHPQQ